MIPQDIPVRIFIQLGYPDTVFVCRLVFGNDIHRNFTQIQIGSDACGGCDPGGLKHITDQ